MRALLESFFDTMDELRVDFGRRMEEIERGARSAPTSSTHAESGHIPHPDQFEEIRYPLGLRPLWTNDHLSAAPVNGGEGKRFPGPTRPGLR
ncbi:hypothetical protein ABZ565_04625 [Streptomyces sp. NPDC016469]|uniref:hypothetical protein n=1 Tax=Streptomyces sp. NPDC016469 TaxID=3157191 RepID=UPI0033CEA8D2